mmetsp:Transcript_58587/g.143294  ORF Transcript_58587/g.143294 Transcript_58587/m.143294 type:complete len:320 (+) Transcript_58587:280-1239(+)|eukprot:CAMPEP_0113440602 /NCGR_PEP_ID=MMETSP0014_2-20120614/644_1 /TAXON_ID=2857 /ORGANISM="Nitzschia sp." /LENGTH=319 /DNA_ID=CAMNT_0000331405 /DNA_START=191 /DNA_END=1153 /DNA_ORIENTATION=+ /assembly_acc=CAM_ASM_000159
MIRTWTIFNSLLAVEPNMKEGVEEYLTKMNATLLRLNFTECDQPIFTEEEMAKRGHRGKEGNTCIDPYPNIKIRWGRYPLLRDALRDCASCTGPVLVTDARDTFFQRDPFGDGAPEVEGLHFYAEHHSITAQDWFVQKRVRQCRRFDFPKGPMICSGTTIGTRDAMISYMDIMYHEMIYWMTADQCTKIKSHGGDQAIMNYLYYTGKFDELRPEINWPRNGIVNTVGVRGIELTKQDYRSGKAIKEAFNVTKSKAKKFSVYDSGENKTSWLAPWLDLVDKEGFFIDLDGTRSRVVHQFDRFGDKSFQNWLASGAVYDTN